MGQKGAVWPPKECMEMKKLILVTLVLCMALSACTKAEVGKAPTAESAAASSVESTASGGKSAASEVSLPEKTKTAAHVTKTLSSGVVVDADVTVPKAMQQQNLPEMQGTGQEIDFEKIKEIFCAGKKITEETEGSYPPDMPGALTEAEKHLSTEDGDYLLVGCGNSFFYTAARDTQDTSNLELYKTGKDLDFATIAEADEEIRKVAEELGISVGDSVCYTIDTSSMPHYIFQYDLLVNGMPLGKFDGGSYSDNVFTPGTYLTAVLDEDGIRHFDVSYVLKETETGDAQRVLTLDEALDKVDEKYNSIIMEGDYYINDIQMAYMPIKTDDAGIVRLIPVWYFQTTHQILLPDKSSTGEIMLPQDGYILINALDGTELLHENGDI